MQKKYLFIVIAMIIFDIIDGDFAHLSILDIVKFILYVICLGLALTNKEEN